MLQKLDFYSSKGGIAGYNLGKKRNLAQRDILKHTERLFHYAGILTVLYEDELQELF